MQDGVAQALSKTMPLSARALRVGVSGRSLLSLYWAEASRPKSSATINKMLGGLDTCVVNVDSAVSSVAVGSLAVPGSEVFVRNRLDIAISPLSFPLNTAVMIMASMIIPNARCVLFIFMIPLFVTPVRVKDSNRK